MFRYRLFLLAFFLWTDLLGQETRLIKSIERDFDVPAETYVELSNKYGNISISTWEHLSIRIRITLIAYGKDEDAADKMLDRVEFDFHQANDYLTVETVFDRRSGFFKDLINSLSDYSKSLLSKNKLNINYEVMIPSNTGSLTIANRYGDVFLEDLSSKVRINLAHGNIHADALMGYSLLDLSYGQANLRELRECRLQLKGMKFESRLIGNLDLTSSSSDMHLGQVKVLNGTSTNDKISIETVGSCNLNADFSEIDLEHLSGTCRINQNYGELEINQVEATCNQLRLYGKSTDYHIQLSRLLPFQAELITREDRLTLGAIDRIFKKEYTDEKEKMIRAIGRNGDQSNPTSIFIDAGNGDLFFDVIMQVNQDHSR